VAFPRLLRSWQPGYRRTTVVEDRPVAEGRRVRCPLDEQPDRSQHSEDGDGT